MVRLMSPLLSVIIPWSNRSELRTTLQRNAAAFQSLPSEVLIVNCGGSPQDLQNLLEDSTLPRLRVIEVSSERFNKCLALNIGAFFSTGSRLLFLDADIVVSSAVVTGMIDLTDNKRFVTIRWVVDSNATARPTGLSESIQTLELVWADGKHLAVEFFRIRAADQARGGPGLICVMKDHFVTVQGMNSRLTSWGWEDMDLIIRLQAMMPVQRTLFGEAEHIYHDDSRRNLKGTTRQQSVQSNMALCYRDYEQGKFMGTLNQDIALSHHTVIEHSSTRPTPDLAPAAINRV
jgi:glycosyltransferase involved in cell wall biosynthesis